VHLAYVDLASVLWAGWVVYFLSMFSSQVSLNERMECFCLRDRLVQRNDDRIYWAAMHCNVHCI